MSSGGPMAIFGHQFMKNIIVLISFGFALVTAGVAYYIKYHEPPLFKIMNPTHFSEPDQLGQVLAERFYVDVKDSESPNIIVGLSQDVATDDLVWTSFQKKLTDLGLKIAPALFLTELPVIQAHLKNSAPIEGHRLIFVPTSLELRRATPPKILSFWTTDYTHLKADGEEPTLLCDYKSPEISFPCLAERVRFSFYRKRLKENLYSAMMQRFFGNQYILYIYEPSK